jgi:hypothetical protein
MCKPPKRRSHAGGHMVPRLGNFPGIQLENTLAEIRKVILDLEIFNRLVFRDWVTG